MVFADLTATEVLLQYVLACLDSLVIACGNASTFLEVLCARTVLYSHDSVKYALSISTTTCVPYLVTLVYPLTSFLASANADLDKCKTRPESGDKSKLSLLEGILIDSAYQNQALIPCIY